MPSTVDLAACLTVADLKSRLRYADPNAPLIVRLAGGSSYAVRLADSGSIDLLKPDGGWNQGVQAFIITASNRK